MKNLLTYVFPLSALALCIYGLTMIDFKTSIFTWPFRAAINSWEYIVGSFVFLGILKLLGRL